MRHNSSLVLPFFLSLALLTLTGCGSLSSKAGKAKMGSGNATAQQKEISNEEKELEELEERITGAPMLITADYFRKTRNSSKTIKLFGGSSEKEKELEKRLARLEERLKGLPERATDPNGMPVLRRKVVLLSLLGDLGLDVLSLLPAALRRTDGLVPVPAQQLAALLQEHGFKVEDLAKAATRREIAAIAGIHAYVLVYFASDKPSVTGQKTALRIDVIHAQESVLIGSYLASVDTFDKVAPKISADVVRGTEWSCRIIRSEGNHVYLNAGRLTGLRPGDKLVVFSRGKEIIDPITKRSLGFAPGEEKGMIEIKNLFGTDASKASILSGGGFGPGDVVKMAELG